MRIKGSHPLSTDSASLAYLLAQATSSPRVTHETGVAYPQVSPLSYIQGALETLTYLGPSLVSYLPVPQRSKIPRCTPAPGGGRLGSRYRGLCWFVWL